MTAQEQIEYLATKVMGWEIKRSPTRERYDRYIKGYWNLNDGSTCPHYSYMRHWNPLTDWNHTMQVVEKAKQIDRWFLLAWRPLDDQWEVQFKGRSLYGSSPQELICNAAILAHQALNPVDPTPISSDNKSS
jgi:hypothetical protein